MDSRRGAILVRHGKGDKRREVGMDRWAWEQLEPWRELRAQFPVGPYFCVLHGPTAGRDWEPSSARRQLSRTAATAGVRRRFAPHQLRHAHAVEMAREGVPLVVIQRQLGHANLGVTSIYLQGIDNSEIIDTVHARRPPVIPATAGLHALPLELGPRATASSPTGRRTTRRRTRQPRLPAATSTPPSMATHLHG